MQTCSESVPARPTRRPTLRMAVALALGVSLLLPGAALAQTPIPPVPAPELDGGVAWINTGKPLKLKDLRGKIVVLDFWTLCCINCMHIMPDLAKLEEKYKNQVVVIGVHSAEVREREEHRDHPQGGPAVRTQAPGRQRRRQEDLERLQVRSGGRRSPSSTPRGTWSPARPASRGSTSRGSTRSIARSDPEAPQEQDARRDPDPVRHGQVPRRAGHPAVLPRQGRRRREGQAAVHRR